MSCLDSLIGVDYGCASTTGRLYLKDVGITEEFLSGLVARHNSSVADWMAERRRLATERVVADVVNHMRPAIRPSTFVDADRIGDYPDQEVLDTAEAGYVQGLMLEVCSPRSNTKLQLSTVQWYGETTGTIRLSIYNMLDGSLVDTLSATAVAGQVTTFEDVDVVVPNSRGTLRLLLVTDQDTFYRATILGNCSSCARYTYKHGPLTATQVRYQAGDKKIYANRTSAGNTGGLSVVASVACDHEAFLCEMKSAMALPLLYSLAYEVMDVALNNYDRWGVKDYRREDLKERRDQFAALYSDQMANLLKFVRVPDDPHCWVCDRRVVSATAFPST